MTQNMIRLDNETVHAPEASAGAIEYLPVGGPTEMPQLNMNQETSADLTGTQSGSGEMPALAANGESTGDSTEYKPIGGTSEMPPVTSNQSAINNFLESGQSKNIDLSGTWKLKIIID